MNCRRIVPRVLIGVVLANAVPANAVTLQPFTTDGCSAFPDGTLTEQELWRQCCLAHDLAYWQGGTHMQRIEADQALRGCVLSQGEPVIATLMLIGVRLGGSPVWPTTFRWGYGWPYPRVYQALTAEELEAVAQAKAALERGGIAESMEGNGSTTILPAENKKNLVD